VIEIPLDVVAKGFGNANQLVTKWVGFAGKASVQVVDLVGRLVEFATVFSDNKGDAIFLFQDASDGSNFVKVRMNYIGCAERLEHGTEWN
jgi:hypothetical protein